jgi:hypothetical protein
VIDGGCVTYEGHEEADNNSWPCCASNIVWLLERDTHRVCILFNWLRSKKLLTLKQAQRLYEIPSSDKSRKCQRYLYNPATCTVAWSFPPMLARRRNIVQQAQYQGPRRVPEVTNSSSAVVLDQLPRVGTLRRRVQLDRRQANLVSCFSTEVRALRGGSTAGHIGAQTSVSG